MQTALIFEALFSAGLVFAVFATTVDRNGPVSFAPFAIGFYLIGASIALSSISGGIFNPSRVIGAAVLTKSYEYLVIFTVGPLVGSLVGVVYDLVYLKKFKKGKNGR